MQPRPQTRLLFATANPAIEAGACQTMEQARIHVALKVCRRREELDSLLKQFAPALLLVGESGLPGTTADTIIKAFSGSGAGSYLVLGEHEYDSAKLHLLPHWGDHYLPVHQLHRLPLAIEETLRDADARASHERLQSEMHRAADAMGESQKLASIGRLAGSIAHEINNPLESITNLLYLISKEVGLPGQVQQYLQMAQSELDRVVEISKQTLTFTRESKAPIPVQVPALLEEVLTLYRRRIHEKRIEIVRQFQDGDGIRVYPGEIRQVFSNLISNALEALEAGGKLLLRVRSSSMRRSETAVSGVRISVADTGMGMDAGTVRRLGEPFFTTKGQRGTGLGLWVTRSIIRRYDGTLRLRSHPGRGTVFSIFLPAGAHPATEQPLRGECDLGDGVAQDRSGSVREESSASASAGHEDASGRTSVVTRGRRLA